MQHAPKGTKTEPALTGPLKVVFGRTVSVPMSWGGDLLPCVHCGESCIGEKRPCLARIHGISVEAQRQYGIVPFAALRESAKTRI